MAQGQGPEKGARSGAAGEASQAPPARRASACGEGAGGGAGAAAAATGATAPAGPPSLCAPTPAVGAPYTTPPTLAEQKAMRLAVRVPVLSVRTTPTWPNSSFRLEVRAAAGVSVAGSYRARSPAMKVDAWAYLTTSMDTYREIGMRVE